ncbi:hypothetical protein E8E12_001817 [Didymella heteroderae]|uniref:Cytochrome P450 n=1 Tax=Didymella heteroderae TaxID=1769908 RepID=A0A9P5BVT9_9PLEO|nr:hypothetical protein E8E12_001817 [Didymella heteroderae]
MQTLETGAASVLLPAIITSFIGYAVYTIIYNVYFHPLAKFPGPLLAATSTYWKAYVECVANRSFCHELVNLHARYGDVVRVGPNELHFASPKAYHDIYNNKNRWDKEARLYKSFGEDRSSFGFLTYTEAKVLDAPGFTAPIVVAMDASLPVFIRFKYSELYKNMIMHCPPRLSRILSPATAGLVDLQQLLKQQIDDLTDDPEKLKQLPHNLTIYHRLMDPEAFRDKTVPSAGSLYEEGQALMFGGADTVGNTLMVGTHHLLQRPEVLQALKIELLTAWPILSKEPKLRELESLPYLNAVIKESLRMSSGVVSGLLRVVPSSGATINGIVVPADTIVSCGSTFVHYNAVIFPEPNVFKPERWLESTELENWLVAFSRGPRMCLGMNLAWAELRLALAHTIRKFHLSLQEPMPDQLLFRDTFLPFFYGKHLQVNVQSVDA